MGCNLGVCYGAVEREHHFCKNKDVVVFAIYKTINIVFTNTGLLS